MKYEETGDACILKHTPFTTTKAHIELNPNSNPTPPDVVPDMTAIKGTLLIDQVSRRSQ